MTSWIPAEPTVPQEQRAAGRVPLRYEDVSQEGHLLLEALPHAVDSIWRLLGQTYAPPYQLDPGVVPILSRMVIEGGEAPFSATGGPLSGSGVYELAHTTGPDGQVNRILLNMWASVVGPLGRTHGPPPADAGRAIVAGRVFAEHVFTRPFAAKAERKVLALGQGAGATVPGRRVDWRAGEAMLELPPGAEALDAELTVDAGETVFGRDHTDSNHHVNSLAYIRVFLEAALRRLAAHGRAQPPLLARALEIAYRRPSFAGERVRVALRCFAEGSRLGVAAVLIGADEAERGLSTARPRCLARLHLEP